MKKIISLLFSLLITLNMIAHTQPNVAVFCSADDKACDQFKIIAYNLGIKLAKHNFGLVTGGSRTGLIKEVVDGYAAHAQNLGHLYGVLPQALAPYNVHHLLIPQNNLKWSKNIHSRLMDFHELADIIIILPGGYGTLHELMDFLVHNQFGLHKTQMLLININGYWDHLISLFQTMLKQQLLSPKHLEALLIVESADQCIEKILLKDNHNTQQGLDSHYWEQKK